MPDVPGHIHCPACGRREPGSRDEHLARITREETARCRCGALLAWRRDEPRHTRQLVLEEVNDG